MCNVAFLFLFSGLPVFPLVLGGLTVHELGEVIK